MMFELLGLRIIVKSWDEIAADLLCACPLPADEGPKEGADLVGLVLTRPVPLNSLVPRLWPAVRVGNALFGDCGDLGGLAIPEL